MTISVAVVGARGFGREHLATLRKLGAEGRTELVAVVDVLGTAGIPDIPATAASFTSLDEMFASTVPDVVVLATPIHTHGTLAELAMRAGSHVLLEKPTTGSLAEFISLIAVADETGRSCQVGFQSFGSDAIPEIERRISSGQLGELRSIGGVGTWLRSTDYYARAAWAGRRRMNGRDVVDGVVTNALAHAVATGLKLAGAVRIDDVHTVTTDLFRAHDIEADDTSAVRINTSGGLSLSFGLSLAAPALPSPHVSVYGTKGTLEFHYTDDIVIVRIGERIEELAFGRMGLLENLCDHLTDGRPLLCDVRETGGFMRVLEAVRTAPDPAPVNPAYVTWIDDENGRHPLVSDVEHWCEQVAIQGRTFTELGAPFAKQAGL